MQKIKKILKATTLLLLLGGVSCGAAFGNCDVYPCGPGTVADAGCNDFNGTTCDFNGTTCGNSNTTCLFGTYPLEETDDGYLLTLGQGCAKTAFKLGGWVETGIMTNSRGATRYTDGAGNSVYGGNGPMHTYGLQRNDFTLQQIYLFLEKEMDATHGWDWGFRTDFIYGNDGVGTQSYGDESFDYDWGTNKHGLGISCYQLFGQVGYKNLTLRGGKFITPIGWEGVSSKNNFFYSHSYCYWIEPSTHVGVLADYAINDRLTLTGGWTAGHDNGFSNRFNDDGAIFGFTYAASDTTNIYYYMTQGNTNNGNFVDGRNRLDDPNLVRSDYFIQSLCIEMNPSKCFTYVMQYNLRNDAAVDRGFNKAYTSSYGINNHFLYHINDCWGVGLRLEWLRDNGGYIIDDPSNYYQATLGVNWTPNKHWSFRPEIRYDTTDGGRAFADGTKCNQLYGGIGALYIF